MREGGGNRKSCGTEVDVASKELDLMMRARRYMRRTRLARIINLQRQTVGTEVDQERMRRGGVKTTGAIS